MGHIQRKGELYPGVETEEEEDGRVEWFMLKWLILAGCVCDFLWKLLFLLTLAQCFTGKATIISNKPQFLLLYELFLYPERLQMKTSTSPLSIAPALGPDSSDTGPCAERSPGSACPRWTPSASARPHGHAPSPPGCQQAGSTASPSPGFAGGDIRLYLEDGVKQYKQICMTYY